METYVSIKNKAKDPSKILIPYEMIADLLLEIEEKELAIKMILKMYDADD